MSDIEILAFVVVPLVALGMGWALALYARRELDRANQMPGE